MPQVNQNPFHPRVHLLDSGWIELQDFMPHPAIGIAGDAAIIAAARTSYLDETKGEEADKKLLFYMMQHNHSSPFEMVEFKFRMRAPLVTYWQLVRHRSFHFMSINSQSGRYTPFEEDDMYHPHVWRLQSNENHQASSGEANTTTSQFMSLTLENFYRHSVSLYQLALSRGIAREQARLFLPGFSMYYTWVLKVDAHNLMHFLKLRMAEDAQYEIRVFADAIYKHWFKPLLPWTAEAFEKFRL